MWKKLKELLGLGKIEGIYKFPDKGANKEKIYIGQSGDVEKRLAQHIHTGKLDKEELPEVEVKVVEGGKETRELAEQQEIEDNDGVKNGKITNERNAMTEKRKKEALKNLIKLINNETD